MRVTQDASVPRAIEDSWWPAETFSPTVNTNRQGISPLDVAFQGSVQPLGLVAVDIEAIVGGSLGWSHRRRTGTEVVVPDGQGSNLTQRIF